MLLGREWKHSLNMTMLVGMPSKIRPQVRHRITAVYSVTVGRDYLAENQIFASDVIKLYVS